MAVDRNHKRKAGDDDVLIKEEWSEESDGAYGRFEAKKRRSSGPATKKSSANAKGKATEKATKQKRRSLAINLRDRIKSVEESDLLDDKEPDPQLPRFLVERRGEFDRKREILKEAGLFLPPDYADIEFSDDERMERLQERPQFPGSVKPSREYRDVELEYSAGVIPASIARYLRDYQVVGVRFLHQLFVYQKGGILGDDMGLGKTVQVAAFLTAAFGKTGDERDAKRMRKMRRAPGKNRWYPKVLIVCPGSVIGNWKQELSRWGWWQTGVFHGSNKEDVLQTAKAGRLEIMITTYVTYRNHREKINTVQWDAVIADECHLLKERRSELTQAMNEINSLCRIGLTGTAIQNKYEELWTLLNWANPGRVGTHLEWKQTIAVPLMLGQSHDATLLQLSLARKTARKLVANLLPQFFLRRMKSLIAHQLPRKSDRVVFCPLTDVQRQAYETFLESNDVQILKLASEACPCGRLTPKKKPAKRGYCCYKTLSNGKWWATAVFPTLQALNKLACHLMLLIPATDKPLEQQEGERTKLQVCLPDRWKELYMKRDSMLYLADPEFCGKWKVLRKLLRFWHESGDKVLVFSNSLRLLRILQHLFHQTSYTFSYLDGSLSYEDRQKAVDDFNSDPGQFVFLISTRAGGVGLNITSANKVVIFDPHWNPAHDLQAQDRAYRIGQVRDVDVFRLISAGTIEEIVYARQIYKQQQANIGYNASVERRYFKGVQENRERKGEIFGLKNMLTFNADQMLLREIVNKTNIAEAKAGVNLSDIDLEKAANDEDSKIGLIKKEDDDDDDGTGGLAQLAEFLTAEGGDDDDDNDDDDDDEVLAARRAARPKSDAVQAILASAGVEYTHENSEVVGSSRVEARLSRRAAALADVEDSDGAGLALGAAAAAAADDLPLFAPDDQANTVPLSMGGRGFRLMYNPPPDVLRRQFCSMAREFGFATATDFGIVVENWTQEQRRNCLEAFYRRREERLAAAAADEEGDSELGVKDEVSVKAEAKDEVGAAWVTDDMDDDGDLEPKAEGDGKFEVKQEEAAEVKVEAGAVAQAVRVKREEPPERKFSSIFVSDDDETDEL